MANDKSNNSIEPVRSSNTKEFTSQVEAQKSRLSVMPLAVLLPAVGDLSMLSQIEANLQKHLHELQQEKLAFSVDESEEQTGRISEESMLNQVLLWLSAGSEES